VLPGVEEVCPASCRSFGWPKSLPAAPIALMAPAVSALEACAQPTTTTISPIADTARRPRCITPATRRRR
jgi:hypothetical protein